MIQDKLIVIATIQNILQGIEQTQHFLSSSASEKQKGIFIGLFMTLRYFYLGITGKEFQRSPRELTIWMNRYVRDQGDALGHRNIVEVRN